MDHFALPSDKMYKAFEVKKLHRNFMGYTASKTQLMISIGISAISDSWYGFAQNVKTIKEYELILAENKIPESRADFTAFLDADDAYEVSALLPGDVCNRCGGGDRIPGLGDGFSDGSPSAGDGVFDPHPVVQIGRAHV